MNYGKLIQLLVWTGRDDSQDLLLGLDSQGKIWMLDWLLGNWTLYDHQVEIERSK